MSFSAKGKEPANSRQCTKCAKDETSLSIPLKCCAKCKSSLYCSRECQQKDWKVHKKICSQQAAQAAQNSNKTSETQNGSFAGDFMRGAAVSTSDSDFQDVMTSSLAAAGIHTGEDEEDWEDVVSETGSATMPDSLPLKKSYKFIVDAYRFRVEDEYTWTGDVSNDSLYGGGNPHAGFGRFLNKAEKQGALPSWWSPSKRKECEKVSRPLVVCAVEKSDLRDEYPDNPFIIMELRALAEKVYRPINGY